MGLQNMSENVRKERVAAGLMESGAHQRCSKPQKSPVIEFDPEAGSTLFPKDRHRARLGTTSYDYGSYFHKSLSAPCLLRGTVVVAGSEVERRDVETRLTYLRKTAEGDAKQPCTVGRRLN